MYTIPAPWDLVLAQDADAAQAVCLWDSAHGVEIERLGAQPPAFGDAIGLHARWFAPVLARHFSCGTTAADAGDTALLSAANRAANRGASFVRQLRGAIASADRLMAAGQPRAALDVMRRRAVTGPEELQSAARLAAAWLAVDPRCTDDRFSAAIALARFVRLAAHRTLDLPIEGAWGRDQLTALAVRAAQWLAAWQA